MCNNGRCAVNNHLFIVCSPLQLRIVLAIKKRYDGDIFHVVYLKTKVGFKDYIRDVLQREFDTYHIANMDYDIINFRRIVSYLNKKIDGNGFVYIANANDLTVQYLMSQLPGSIKLRTFDDGILNINTIFDINHKLKEKKKLKYILTRLFYENTYSIRKIVEQSSLHLTILDKNRTLNVNAELVKLDVFEHNDAELNTSAHIKRPFVNVFIGSKFKDILANKSIQNLDLLVHKIKKINLDYENAVYLRHPRENSCEVFSMDEINIDSISEDYIYELVKQGNIVNVIGFASTCQLNVMNLPNVNVVLLKTELIRDDIIASFSLFNKKDTITIYPLDE